LWTRGFAYAVLRRERIKRKIFITQSTQYTDLLHTDIDSNSIFSGFVSRD